MDKELAQLKSLLSDVESEQHRGKEFIRGRMGDTSVVLMKCGIGKVNAAVGAVELITRYNPEVVVSSGCAGGNGEELDVQDIVVSSELCYHDVYCGAAVGESVYGQVQGLPARYAVDTTLLQKATSIAAPVRIVPGLIVTGDWFVDSREKMQEIIGHFPEARAIDMESAAIAQVCYIYKVPFISFRVISDIPLRDHKAAMYHDFWDTIAQNSFQVTRNFIQSLT